MYIPNAYRVEDFDTLVAFMRANSFITLVSTVDGAPFASHIPVALDVRDGAVTISGHVARANPHWQAFAQGESLAIFTGPHAYISPTLYEQRESVPTWNYIAVHAYGSPRVLTFGEARAAMEATVRALVATYEASYQQQWDTLSEKYRSGMLRGIVAFELPVTRLEGKYKLSQNRSAADQHTVAHALLGSDDPAAAATGRAMDDGVTGEVSAS